MAVHGADRLGIVAAMTRVLADAGGNVTDLTHPAGRPALRGGRRGRAAARAARRVGRHGSPRSAAELGVEVTLRRADSDLL